MHRSRSEYRMSPIQVVPTSAPLPTVRPDEHHHAALAALMLAAYRDTVDDEGESLEDAVDAIRYYLGAIVRSHSFVMVDGSHPVAFAFVVVDGVHYIDPVVVAPDRKRRGLGGALVRRCLTSLADAGISEVGATITDGNVASERLFTGLGFRRYGTWN